MVAVPSIGRAGQPHPQHSAPEADATRRLYEQYARQIYAYCLHQLRNKEEAEDAVQSTFLNAFRGLQRGVDPEFESAWLYKIAQNVCLTRQRSSSRRNRVESPGDLDAMQDFLPAREVDSDDLIGLPEALHEMPEQQRRALLLREWQGLSYKEIADEMGLSQAAVETLLFRARRTLASGLGDEPKRGLAKRVQNGGDAGSLVALVKSLLLTGGAKVAATVATVAATSVVAATPAARHAVEQAVVPPSVAPKAPAAHVHRKAPVAHRAPAAAAVVHHVAAAPAAPAARVVTHHAVRRHTVRHVAATRHVPAHARPSAAVVAAAAAAATAPVEPAAAPPAPATPAAAPVETTPTPPAPPAPPAPAAPAPPTPPTAAPQHDEKADAAKPQTPTPPTPPTPPGQAAKASAAPSEPAAAPEGKAKGHEKAGVLQPARDVTTAAPTPPAPAPTASTPAPVTPAPPVPPVTAAPTTVHVPSGNAWGRAKQAQPAPTTTVPAPPTTVASTTTTAATTPTAPTSTTVTTPGPTQPVSPQPAGPPADHGNGWGRHH